MKDLRIGKYRITFTERPYSGKQKRGLEKSYDKVFFIVDCDEQKVIECTIESGDVTRKTAFVILKYDQATVFAPTTDARIFMVFQDYFCIFNPETLEIENRQEVDIGPIFAVYPYKEDFILHGELSICRVNRNLEILWEFGARDIFVRQDDEPAFEMKPDRICLYDWLGYYYEITYDGEQLTEYQPKR